MVVSLQGIGMKREFTREEIEEGIEIISKAISIADEFCY